MKKLFTIILGLLISIHAYALPNASGDNKPLIAKKIQNKKDNVACVAQCRIKVKAHCIKVKDSANPCPRRGGAKAFCAKKCG